MGTHLVSLKWLAEHYDDPQVKVVDCRFVLGNPEAGLASYVESHVPGAYYFDLEQDLSGKKDAHGGRHPLPDPEELAQKLSAARIDADTHVVAYDDQGGAMASRFWWLLRYLGHERVSVLDGSFAAWKERGCPTTADVPTALGEPGTFTPLLQPHMVVNIKELKQRLERPGVVLLDSREEVRYRGEQEPIDPVAGHIPGAQNAFWKNSLNEQGTWKAAAEQEERFAAHAGLKEAEEIIVYCGSGVTACPNILALEEAGYRNVKLYPGSWSDWCSYPDNPIATATRKEGE